MKKFLMCLFLYSLSLSGSDADPDTNFKNEMAERDLKWDVSGDSPGCIKITSRGALQRFLEAKGDPNKTLDQYVCGSDGSRIEKVPMLIEALTSPNPIAVSLLVAAKADLNGRVEEYGTPLEFALRRQQFVAKGLNKDYGDNHQRVNEYDSIVTLLKRAQDASK